MINRVKFGVDAEDNIYTEEWGLGMPFFEGKAQQFKSQKVSKEKQLQQHIKAQKRQRSAAAAGGNVSGMASSLAFTPVQGLELANPTAARKAPDVGDKYFATSAGFVNLSTPMRI
mmetsp:Transcript_21738/g.32221  ORF Transcript_21738/g.32221 Transcript_21738/m.32221 type:complete len:115 (-) Transcript_21738:39-383(-)